MSADLEDKIVARWVAAGAVCCDPVWEAAYSRFETREEEISKFLRRLRGFGVEGWSRDLEIVELFCGRGSGLEAWTGLGFHRVEGVDLSEGLLGQCRGGARLYLGDCRHMGFPDASRDVLCVQGGLHHLPDLPGDLRAVLGEARRVLRPGGHLLLVEPWNTPLLRLIHLLSRRRIVQGLSPKIRALATMEEREAVTYERWLARPREILQELAAGFEVAEARVGGIALHWHGRKVS